jgi:hypothetical protein
LRSFGKLGSPAGVEMPQVPAAATSPSCEFVLQRDEHRSFGDVVHAVLRRHVEEETEAVRRRLRGHPRRITDTVDDRADQPGVVPEQARSTSSQPAPAQADSAIRCREVCDEFDLLVGKGADFLAIDGDRTDQFVFLLRPIQSYDTERYFLD